MQINTTTRTDDRLFWKICLRQGLFISFPQLSSRENHKIGAFSLFGYAIPTIMGIIVEKWDDSGDCLVCLYPFMERENWERQTNLIGCARVRVDKSFLLEQVDIEELLTHPVSLVRQAAQRYYNRS